MKKKALFTILFLGFFVSGCKKSHVPDPNTIYRGVVLYSECSVAVVQTIGPNYLGADTWAAGTYSGAPVYHHVFRVQNGCQLSDTMGADTFNFKIVSPQVQNCMIVVAAPDISYPIQVVN